MTRAGPIDILYIDDEPDLREIVSVALEMDSGITVRSCADAPAAWEQIAACRPDLIILDVVMPGTDGPAFFAALKDTPATEAIPVVFMTAKVLQAELAMLRALQPAGIVQKPFNPRTLATEMRHYCTAVPETAHESLDETLERLQERFAARARDTAARLHAGLYLPPDDPGTARRIAHSLCGTAGTLGFHDVAGLAADIDAAPPESPIEDKVQRLAAMLLAIPVPSSDNQA